MEDLLPRYLDGETSQSTDVSLVLTEQSLIIMHQHITLADWPYSKIFVKEDWTDMVGAILGHRDYPDASLSFYRPQEFNRILQKLDRRSQKSFIIPIQYRHILLMLVGAIATGFVLFPAIGYLAAATTYFIPLSVEKKLGDAVMLQMETSLVRCDDKAAIENLQKIVRRLAISSSHQKSTPDIYVFKSFTPNAFSLPGHKIAVLSAFLNDAKSENEIAAVMAHEMGHMVKRDALEAYVESQGLSIISGLIGSSGSYGGVANIATFMQSMNYSRQKEFIADKYGAELLLKAGYSLKGLSNFLERMDKQQSPDMNKAMKYFELLSTHPDTEERIRRIGKYGGKDSFKPSLTQDEFRTLKNACTGKS